MTLVDADGTPIGQNPGPEVLEPQTETDPQVRVLVNVYEDTPYPGVDFPTQQRQLAFRAGQTIRRSQWDARFVVPTIARITPNEGPAAGDTQITIIGSRFAPGATVTIGGTDAAGVAVEDSERLTCTTPAGAAGAADVVVTTPGGSATKTAGFTYA